MAASQPVLVAAPVDVAPFVPPVLASLQVGVTGAGTVTGSGDGLKIACGAQGSNCFSGGVKPGTTVKLHAGAADGFKFSGWTGGVCNGQTPTCTVSLQKASNVAAKFVAAPGSDIVPLALGKAAFQVRWDQSLGTGKLTLGGKIAKPAVVKVVLSRSGGAPLITEHLSLPAGPFSLALKLEPSLKILPGGFVVTISGHSGSFKVPTEVKTVTLDAPPEGVVLKAFASGSERGGPAAIVHASSREAFVHFVFQALPRGKQPLTVSWYRPDGKLLGTANKPTAPDITSSIQSGAPLPKGNWRVDLKAGGKLVKSLPVQIR